MKSTNKNRLILAYLLSYIGFPNNVYASVNESELCAKTIEWVANKSENVLIDRDHVIHIMNRHIKNDSLGVNDWILTVNMGKAAESIEEFQDYLKLALKDGFTSEVLGSGPGGGGSTKLACKYTLFYYVGQNAKDDKNITKKLRIVFNYIPTNALLYPDNTPISIVSILPIGKK